MTNLGEKIKINIFWRIKNCGQVCVCGFIYIDETY